MGAGAEGFADDVALAVRISCALIHRHRPDLLDWESLDKVGQPLSIH